MKHIFILFFLSISISVESQVIISGVAKNYKDSFFYISESGGFNNLTRAWRDARIKVSIEKNGHFKTSIPEESINSWYIATDEGNQFFDLIKGQCIELLADFSKPTPLIAIRENKDDFNYSAFIRGKMNEYYSVSSLQQKLHGTNIDSILYFRTVLANYKSAMLKSYKKTHGVSDIYYRWLSSKYLYEPYERTLVEDVKSRDSLKEETIKNITCKVGNDDYAAMNITEYNDLASFYIQTKYKKEANKPFSLSEYFSFAANLKSISKNTRDVFLTRLLYSISKFPDSAYNPLLKRYNKIIANEKLKHLIKQKRSEYTTTSNENIQTHSEITSFEKLIKPYKGKVVYIDFWASWCTPCLAEMPNSLALKEKLKGRNVAFLYLGYNDKEKAWANARKRLKLGGDHFLLSQQMITEANRIFEISGIPHFALLDKNGVIVSKKAGRPSEVYQEILKLLEN